MGYALNGVTRTCERLAPVKSLTSVMLQLAMSVAIMLTSKLNPCGPGVLIENETHSVDRVCFNKMSGAMHMVYKVLIIT